jgi:hypothetical protein
MEGKEKKIKLLKAIQYGSIKPEELADGCITLIKQKDGEFRRKHGGKVMTLEDIEALKQRVDILEMEMSYRDEILLLWCSFEDLMKAASQI